MTMRSTWKNAGKFFGGEKNLISSVKSYPVACGKGKWCRGTRPSRSGCTMTNNVGCGLSFRDALLAFVCQSPAALVSRTTSL